jgi:hypothetical protein
MPSSFDFVDRPRVARAAYPQAPVRFPPFGEANRSTKTMIEEPAPPKPFTFGKKSAIGRRRPSGHLVSLIIFAAVLLIVVLIAIAGTLVKWLWMRQLDYAGIFWTLLSVQWTMFFAAFVFAFLFLWVNFRQAIRNNADFGGVGSTARSVFFDGTDPLRPISIGVSPRLFKLAAVAGSAVVAFFFALGFQGQWDTYLRFRYGGSFGASDPLFGVDIGFYLFHLPFYSLLQSTLMMLIVLALAGAVMAYMFFGVLRLSGGPIQASRKATSHLSVLLFILVPSWGWGLYLDHYNLVYSTLGVVFRA